jgi:hypothetical protein
MGLGPAQGNQNHPRCPVSGHAMACPYNDWRRLIFGRVYASEMRGSVTAVSYNTRFTIYNS